MAQTNMHLSADIIMYLCRSCEVHEDLYVFNSIQLACNLSSVVSVAFTPTSALNITRANNLCPMTVHVTSVFALTLLIVIACGHQDSAVFQQSSC